MQTLCCAACHLLIVSTQDVQFLVFDALLLGKCSFAYCSLAIAVSYDLASSRPAP